MFQLSKETFVAKLKNKIQYFEDYSSLRRFGHVISVAITPLFKRLFWFVTLSACCLGAGVLLKASLSLYAQDAVSYSVETDYLKWDTPFPAVTLCEYYFNDDKVTEALLKNNISKGFANFGKDIAFWKPCKTCFNCKLNQTCVNNFLHLVNVIRSNCEQTLTQCWWNDEPFPCCERFQPIETQYGTCFVFNARQTGTEDIELVNRNMDLPTLTFSAAEHVMIRVHSPDEILTVSTDNKQLGTCNKLPLISDIDVSVSAEQTINDLTVRSIAQGSRDCLFHDERPPTPEHWPFPRYSFSGCVWYCKAAAQAELCNCTHHFMPTVGDLAVCDVQGLACLNKNKDSLAVNECDCPMDCEEMNYNVVHVRCNRTNKPWSDELKARGTLGTVKLAQLPSLRMRRHAIRDTLGLVVDFGGVMGVFFGASLLSFIEIVYIFCLRKSH